MKRTAAFLSVTFAVVLLAILSLDATYDRHNGEHLFKAPSVSGLNTQERAQSTLQKSERDIVFIENLGQITDTKGEKRPDILFLTRSQGIDMYMTNSGISYVFRNAASGYYRLDMEFVGMNKNVNIKKELAVDQQYHYYTPEYPDGISPRAYKKVTIENIYEGIDLVYYEKEGRMKYDFVLKAGADAGKIKMRYKGAGSMDIDNNGDVIITTPMGEIREEKPYTWSRTTGSEIESRYRVKNNTVMFDITEYDESEDIIIDPIRIWATYYGGSGNDNGNSICTDNLGNLYVTGRTASSDFPTQTLSGAYNQTTYGGGADAFILKFNSSGERIWSTYYGGSGNEEGFGICKDNSGNLYVTGQTGGNDFPLQTLAGAYNQTIYGGGSNDVFILKFNSSGARIWATYYGGNKNDHGYGICTDNSGNLYITGNAQSTDFPIQTLPGAYNQTNFGGNFYGDGFILKFNNFGVRIWATYYGGNGGDYGYSIYTDNSGNLYVTGGTFSEDFPTQTLTGAYNQTYGGGYLHDDAFISKFNSSCALIWSTYYGGSYHDGGLAIYTDNSANLYVTGYTESNNFPTQTLSGAYNQASSGGGSDAFILKFNSSCARLWATYYGGNSFEEGEGIYTDNSGRLYVTGNTLSSNFPTQTLMGAFNQTTYGGGGDAFILEFNSSCARQWATYYGGSDDEEGRDICTDNSGNLYITGQTGSSNFPIQALTGAYNQSTTGGSLDAFILRFGELYAAFSASDNTICEGDTVRFTDQSPGNVISWDWVFPGGIPGTSTLQNPTVTYPAAGEYDVELTVSDGIETVTELKEDHIIVMTIPVQPDTPSGPVETCAGGSYNYTIYSVAYADYYEWMVEPGDAGTISGTGTIGTFEAATDWTGAYTIKVRAVNDCGTGEWSDTLEANLNSMPAVFNLTGGGEYCEGGEGRELFLDGSEIGVDYEIFHGFFSTGVVLPGTGGALNFGFFADEGIYTAKGHSEYCTEFMEGQIGISSVPPPGQPGTPAGPESVCRGDISVYTTTEASDADTYTWLLAPPEAGMLTPDGLSVEILWSESFSEQAHLSVAGTNECGNGLFSEELVITHVGPEPEISGLQLVCVGDVTYYMTADNPGNSYTWEVSGGTLISGAGTHQISVEWGDPGSGYVMVTEDNGTCSSTTEQFGAVISECTGIGDNESLNLKVYPNPAQNVLNIYLGTIRELKDGTISLISIQGKVVNTVKVTEGLRNIRINTSDYAPGLYYIHVVEDDQVIGARKVVIER